MQIPAAVITAWAQGRLVISTGAGVSMAEPSNLPRFLGVAKKVAERLRSSLNPKDDQWVTKPDTFMDVLGQAPGPDVRGHGHGQRIAAKHGSEPIDNHDALARIAPRYATYVATTNYDRQVETTLDGRGWDGEQVLESTEHDLRIAATHDRACSPEGSPLDVN